MVDNVARIVVLPTGDHIEQELLLDADKGCHKVGGNGVNLATEIVQFGSHRNSGRHLIATLVYTLSNSGRFVEWHVDLRN